MREKTSPSGEKNHGLFLCSSDMLIASISFVIKFLLETVQFIGGSG